MKLDELKNKYKEFTIKELISKEEVQKKCIEAAQ